MFLLKGVWHGERKLAGKDALLLLGLLWLTLACYKLVCFLWLCMLSVLSSLVFGKELAISSKKVTKAPQDFTQAEEDRMPPKMTATYHTCLQAVCTNTKQQVNNERQLEKE